MTDVESLRLEDVRAAFRRAFGGTPTHVARAPGRVNLVGEHVDYAGLPVLPMAIQRNVVILFRARDGDTIRLVDCDETFPPRSFALRTPIEPYATGDWGNYVKAAAQGLADRYGPLTGIDAAVCSSVPVAAGLSSSSALLIASGLAFLTASGITPDVHSGKGGDPEPRAPGPHAMSQSPYATLMARAERYVGTQGGGMDQAVILGGRRGCAVRIDFDPLRLTHVAVPQDWRFIVANSLVPAPKSGSARDAYNRRRAECHEALRVLAKSLYPSEQVDSYSELLERADAERLLKEGNRVLGATMLSRLRHVVSEADRVTQAEAAMVRGDLEQFGRLMSESHQSLRDDYEVSCAELDQLVDIALGAGATSARLTGAGFGGCIVALAAADRADRVLEALADRFYAHHDVPGDHLFVAEPSDGAEVSEE